MAKEVWYQAGLSFGCTQCGHCCSGDPGHVWTTKEEIRRISKFLGHTDGRLDKKHLRRVGFRHSLTERSNGDCIFLKREGGRGICEIYPVRPLQCRTWPFWRRNLRSSDEWKEAHEACPGMNCGEHYDFAQIEALRVQKSW